MYRILPSFKLSLAFLFILLSYAFAKAETCSYTNDNNSVYVDAGVQINVDHFSKVASEDQSVFHLVTHGKPGALWIDGAWLSDQSLIKWLENRPEMDSARSLYLYACEFAKGDKGLQAVKNIEKHLGIVVAASTNVTGRGGDAFLEIGNINVSASLESLEGSLQLDTKHYLPPIHGQYETNAVRHEEVHLSTPSTNAIQILVTDGAGNPITGSPFTISKGSPTIINFGVAPTAPVSISNTQRGIVQDGDDEGLIFTSSSPFYVNYRANSSPQAGSLTSKGQQALGKKFKWAAPRNKSYFTNTTRAILSFMAIETAVVTISDLDPNIRFYDANNVSGLAPSASGELVFNLSAGESVVLEALGNNDANQSGFVGADISSSGRIAVTTGGTLLTPFENDLASDIGIDQLVPISKLGNEHVIVKGNGSDEFVHVVATQDNTEVYVNGATTPFSTLDEGDSVQIPSANFSANNNMLVSSNQPIYVHHILQGSSATNTIGMNFIPPLSCFMPSVADEIPQIAKINTTTYNNTEAIIITQVGATVTINGVNINGAPYNIAEKSVTGSSVWVTYRVPLANDNYTFNSTASMAVGMFGASSLAGYAGYFLALEQVRKSHRLLTLYVIMEY
jgi:hypothetical protein